MNVSKAITDNVPENMHELMAEREKIIKRLAAINGEIATLQTMFDAATASGYIPETMAVTDGE